VWPRRHHLLQAVFCSGTGTGTRFGFFTVSGPGTGFRCRRFSNHFFVSWAGTWAC
jgi:hypothetical protein